MGFIAAAIPVVFGMQSFGAFVMQFVGSIVMSALSRVLFSKEEPFSAAPRTIMVRDPAKAWQIAYGETRVSGVVVFIHSSSKSISQASQDDDDGTQVLHIVLALVRHRIKAFRSIHFNDDVVELDGDGAAIGKYADHAFIYTHRGDADQAADATLMEWLPHKWTADHRGKGVAYIYAQLWYDDQLYPSLPRISATILGHDQIYDPRDATYKYSTNPILCARDFLTNSIYGVGAPAADVPDAITNAQANICDEPVATASVASGFTVGPQVEFTASISMTFHHERRGEPRSKTTPDAFKLDDPLRVSTGDKVLLSGSGLPGGFAANTTYYWITSTRNRIANNNLEQASVGQLATSEANALAGTAKDVTADGTGIIARADTILIADDKLGNIQTGDTVRVASTGALPAPLAAATDYFVIRGNDNQTIQLATTLDNAVNDVAIVFTSFGSGNHTITRGSEPRYTCNGILTTDTKRDDAIASLLASCAGSLVETGGEYRLYAGAHSGSVRTIGEGDLRGGIVISPLISRRELFNAVKGTYWSRTNFDQPADFPAVKDANGALEDGETLWRDITLPFTNSTGTAQRLAAILLAQTREQMSCGIPLTLQAGFELQAGDTIALNIPRYGFATKEFRITEKKLVIKEVDGRASALGVDVFVREWGSAIFDWDAEDETPYTPIPNTNLPSPFADPSAPAAPTISEELYQSQPGAGLKTKVVVAWTIGQAGFIDRFEVQHRASGATTWINGATVGQFDRQADLFDIADGLREFRVRAITRTNRTSNWSAVTTYEVQGLSAPPADVTGFAVLALGAQGHAIWDEHPDLDVRIGGHLRLKWSPLTSGASVSVATDLAMQPNGNQTIAQIPLRTGTYFAKAVDSNGNESINWAVFITTLADAITYDAAITQAEHPAWTGSVSDLVVDGSILKLETLGTLVDDWPDWDGVADVDIEGTGLATEGTYTLADPIDLGAVYDVRVWFDVAGTVTGLGLTIDERADPIDEWDDFEGDDAPASPATAYVEVRTTQDDPAGTPVWSEWVRVTVADFRCRGIDARLVVKTTDANVNYEVEEWTIHIDVPERREFGVDLTVGAGGTAVSYALPFYSKPGVFPSIKNAQAGDRYTITSDDEDGFTINIYDGGGSGVSRVIDWQAVGFGREN